jgi:2-C-methyl-D-erythritol 4-phosphate cytidylyltransferase
MKGELKKEYRTLSGMPVLAHAIIPFITINLFTHIIVTVPHTDKEKVGHLLESFIEISSISIIGGGATRQESVYLALKSLETSHPEYILVHDGARPWVEELLIQKVFEGTAAYGACIPVVDVLDALKEVDKRGFIRKNLNREYIKGAQTPQGFLFERLLKTHMYAREHHYKALDDAQVYSLLFGPVSTVNGNVRNKKITYSFDLEDRWS